MVRRLRTSFVWPAALGPIILGAACAAPPVTTVEAEPGAPLPGLSAAEAEAFAAGQALFNRPFAPEEGLGPIFNQDRCSSCHDLPTSGGHGADPVTKVSRFEPAVGCSLLEDEGGDLIQARLVPALSALGVPPERLPSDATEITRLRPPALYGLGLVEAVPREDILSRADPDDADGDGIRGRPAILADGSLGRFGGKGQDPTLFRFVEAATRGELGLTTPLHPLEHLPNGRPFPQGVDPTPEPEIDEASLGLLVAYVRFLAPPTPRPPDDPARADDVRRGARVFEEIGCASCHVPTMVTGPNDSPALDRKSFRIYSDLLLHDLGGEIMDVCAPGVSPAERITARLVGLGLRRDFMHDGVAQGVEPAIRFHGGEAAGSRRAFGALDERRRELLYLFLWTL